MADWASMRRGPEQWRRLIERYERGTLTQARFCEREGIAPSTFQYWRRRLREEAGDCVAPSGAERLVEVRVREEPREPAGTGLRIVLPSGLSIAVEAGFDAATLQRVLEILGAPA
jgi:transposase-like protein